MIHKSIAEVESNIWLQSNKELRQLIFIPISPKRLSIHNTSSRRFSRQSLKLLTLTRLSQNQALHTQISNLTKYFNTLQTATHTKTQLPQRIHTTTNYKPPPYPSYGCNTTQTPRLHCFSRASHRMSRHLQILHDSLLRPPSPRQTQPRINGRSRLQE